MSFDKKAYNKIRNTKPEVKAANRITSEAGKLLRKVKRIIKLLV